MYSSILEALFAVVLGDLLYAGAPVKVTFQANTCGVPDTLNALSTVQVRGSVYPLTWEYTSPAKMINAKGEYWKCAVTFNARETVFYNYFTNAKSSITESDSGWESDISDWGNGRRRLIVGDKDTTLPLEFVNGFKNLASQWEAPFPTGKQDTLVCYVRVNMQSYPDFDSALHKVGIRGSFAASNWGTSVILAPEAPHPKPGQVKYEASHFYTVPIYWAKSKLDSAKTYEEGVMRYKFVIHRKNAQNDEDWSLLVVNPNQQFEFTMPKQDTVPGWTWYKTSVEYWIRDSMNIQFRTELSKAIKNGGFRIGDTVVVKYGYLGSAAIVYTDTLEKEDGSNNIYRTQVRLLLGITLRNKPLYYKYYLFKSGVDYPESYNDFTFNSSPYRSIILPSTQHASITAYDTINSVVAPHRQPVFRYAAKLSRDVRVTFTCDLRPAYYSLAAGDSLFDEQDAFRTILPSDKDSVFAWGVWFNGPAVGGWNNPTGADWGDGLRNNLAKKMYDDGTHGDKKANDSIYSITVQFYKDSSNKYVGQVFKFGLNAGDNESGKAGFGINHIGNINDKDSVATIASQFGEINPLYYKGWNYDTQTSTITSVESMSIEIPSQYHLLQNYPNPFNLTTVISYRLPVISKVTLKIYDLLGREVRGLVNEEQPAGWKQVPWNASGCASGIYFYTLRTGTFFDKRKMLLVK